MKKAQIFSMDMMFAAIIFIGVLMIIVYLWDTSIRIIASDESRKSLELDARNIVSQLLMREGYPSDWTSNSVISAIGLTVSSSMNFLNSTYKSRAMGLSNRGLGVLDASKLNALQNMNYTQSKPYLGIFEEDKNYYLLVQRWNGTGYIQTNAIGIAPYTNATTVINVDRFGLMDNNFVKFNLRVWRLCETC